MMTTPIWFKAFSSVDPSHIGLCCPVPFLSVPSRCFWILHGTMPGVDHSLSSGSALMQALPQILPLTNGFCLLMACLLDCACLTWFYLLLIGSVYWVVHSFLAKQGKCVKKISLPCHNSFQSSSHSWLRTALRWCISKAYPALRGVICQSLFSWNGYQGNSNRFWTLLTSSALFSPLNPAVVFWKSLPFFPGCGLAFLQRCFGVHFSGQKDTLNRLHSCLTADMSKTWKEKSCYFDSIV